MDWVVLGFFLFFTPSMFLRNFIHNRCLKYSWFCVIRIPSIVLLQSIPVEKGHSGSVSAGQTTVWKVEQVPESWWDPVLQTRGTWAAPSVQKAQAGASVKTEISSQSITSPGEGFLQSKEPRITSWVPAQAEGSLPAPLGHRTSSDQMVPPSSTSLVQHLT